jgi:predicted site-specific integrase-resolvase
MNTERKAFGQKELSEYLGVSKATVNQWQRMGKFEGCYLRVGRKIVYNLDDIDTKFKH